MREVSSLYFLASQQLGSGTSSAPDETYGCSSKLTGSEPRLSCGPKAGPDTQTTVSSWLRSWTHACSNVMDSDPTSGMLSQRSLPELSMCAWTS